MWPFTTLSTMSPYPSPLKMCPAICQFFFRSLVFSVFWSLLLLGRWEGVFEKSEYASSKHCSLPAENTFWKSTANFLVFSISERRMPKHWLRVIHLTKSSWPNEFDQTMLTINPNKIYDDNYAHRAPALIKQQL